VLNKFATPAKKDNFQKMHENAILYLFWQPRLYRMHAATMRYGKEKTYTVDEMLTDLDKGLWAELQNHQAVDSYKRMVQKSEVAYMMSCLEGADKPSTSDSDLSSTDVPVVLRSHLKSIMKQCNTALPAYSDPEMIAHLKYLSSKIDSYLNPKNN
jgi:hypothetical protein